MKPNSLGVSAPLLSTTSQHIANPLRPQMVSATPYSLQDHSQVAAASAHNAPQPTGPGHAPALSKLGANPSSIHPSQVLGQRSLHRFMTR